MDFLSEFELMHVDEFIDELLHSERVCDIILPRLQVRDKGHTYTVHNNMCVKIPLYTYIIKHYGSQNLFLTEV